MRRRRGCWWRRRSSGGGGVALALLDEAAVRFDFSQYTDVDNMVDVNGGWGPIDPSDIVGTPSFTADGLRLVDGQNNDTNLWKIESVDSPLVLGADGMTLIQVWRLDTEPSQGGIGSRGRLVYTELTRASTAFLPEILGAWIVRFNFPAQNDPYAVTVYDTDSGIVVDRNNGDVNSGMRNAFATGTFVWVCVVDADLGEIRLTLLGPEGRFDDTSPFLISAQFPTNPATLDNVLCTTPNSNDVTLIEFDGWNRAHSVAEVDALIAHFVPEPPDPEALLAEAAVRFDFSQYSDVDDMVDVNGGYGPLTWGGGGPGSYEFTALGLRLISGNLIADTVGLPSPLIAGPDGVSVLAVIQLAAPRLDWSGSAIRCILVGDGLGDFEPTVNVSYGLAHSGTVNPAHHFDFYQAYLEDLDFQTVVDAQAQLATGTADDYEGVLIGCWVYDVPAGAVRVKVVTAAGTTVDETTLFDIPVPLFVSSPTVIDTVHLDASISSTDYTAIEYVAANRAWTVAEVDALIAHFAA